jgi:hypothetical protein
MLSNNSEQYDYGKLARLNKSEDFAALKLVIDDIMSDLKNVQNVNRGNFEADGLGRIYAYEAFEQLLNTVKGAEQAMDINNPEIGDNNYT